jgi:hypothetical protein
LKWAVTACGGGKPALPDHLWTELELTDERRFQGGVVQVG